MHIKEIERHVDMAVNLLKALSNARRLKIVCALHDRERSVGDLEKIIGLSQSALSQHLARLRRDGVVTTRREAQTIYYSANMTIVSPVMDLLSKLATTKSASSGP